MESVVFDLSALTYTQGLASEHENGAVPSFVCLMHIPSFVSSPDMQRDKSPVTYLTNPPSATEK